MDRETNEIITKNPAEIAQKLFNGSASDLVSSEAILAKIKTLPNYNALVAAAKETFSRDKLVLPESKVVPGSNAWYRQFINREA